MIAADGAAAATQVGAFVAVRVVDTPRSSPAMTSAPRGRDGVPADPRRAGS